MLVLWLVIPLFLIILDPATLHLHTSRGLQLFRLFKAQQKHAQHEQGKVIICAVMDKLLSYAEEAGQN